MAMMTTTNPAAQATDRMQTYFSKKLLPRARQATVLEQYGNRVAFPKDATSKTMRFFRKQAGAASNVLTLTEGVVGTTYRELDFDYVEATLVQYGIKARISDVMTMLQLFNLLEETIDSIGEDVALHADQIIRNELIGSITGAGNKRYAQQLANWAALAAATPSTGCVVLTDLLDAMTQLTINRAPEKNGEYFAVCPPQVIRDFMNDSKFTQLGVYQNSTKIMNGEVGKWYNIRIIKTTVPFREATNGAEGTFAASGGIFASIILGSDAFGTPIMGGGSPFSPRMMICDKADKSDELNQFITAGTKLFWTSKTLNSDWAVVLRSLTAFA